MNRECLVRGLAVPSNKREPTALAYGFYMNTERLLDALIFGDGRY